MGGGGGGGGKGWGEVVGGAAPGRGTPPAQLHVGGVGELPTGLLGSTPEANAFS